MLSKLTQDSRTYTLCTSANSIILIRKPHVHASTIEYLYSPTPVYSDTNLPVVCIEVVGALNDQLWSSTDTCHSKRVKDEYQGQIPGLKSNII